MACNPRPDLLPQTDPHRDAAAMSVYVADFGTGSAMSKRTRDPFSHAWRVTYRIAEDLAWTGGFCSTQQLAEDAAARHAKLIGPARRRSSAQLHQVEIAEARRLAHDPVSAHASGVADAFEPVRSND